MRIHDHETDTKRIAELCAEYEEQIALLKKEHGEEVKALLDRHEADIDLLSTRLKSVEEELHEVNCEYDGYRRAVIDMLG